MSAIAPVGEARKVVGTWRLLEVIVPPAIRALRGANPDGMIVYDANGYMTVQISPDRERGDYAGKVPTPEQAVAALTGYGAYFGTYTVDVEAGTITHHREANLKPALLGSFVRRFEMPNPDRLVLRPIESTNALVWRRVT
jgi:hypothetical protein